MTADAWSRRRSWACAIGVGPSSLLAILTTLRGAGLVSRSARDGRYVPGPGLVALGTAAAQRLADQASVSSGPAFGLAPLVLSQTIAIREAGLPCRERCSYL